MERPKVSVKLRSNSVSLKSSPATSEAGREIKASSRVEEAKEDEWTSSRGSSRTANKRKDGSKAKEKVDDKLNNENWNILRKIFEQAEEDCGGGLDINVATKAFKVAFQQELDDRSLNTPLMKADTNCNRKIDMKQQESPKAKGKMEDQPNSENSSMLRKIFELGEGSCVNGLHINGVVKALKVAIQPELDDKKLNALLMKVGTNCDETFPSKLKEARKKKRKIEEQLNNENLKMLQEIFEEADENCRGGLQIDEFAKALKLAFQHELDDRQLSMLFMKVDTNCDDKVDWEEFCDYMLLEKQQKDSMSRDISEMPFPNPDRVIHSPHHDVLVGLSYLPSFGKNSNSEEPDSSSGKYVSCGKDGMMVFWNLELKPQKTVMLADYNVSVRKSRQVWVTSLVALGNVKKVAVATTDSDVTFYDCSANNFDKQFMITGFPHCVISMDYWHNPRNMNESLILFGDVGGGVSSLMFSEATTNLFDVNIGNVFVRSNLVYRIIPFKELFYKNHRSVNGVTIPKIHDDWVRKVKYLPNLQCFISCCNTSNTSLYLGDLERKKMKSYFRARKGIYTFDYDKDSNSIITGGPDRIIRLWNPYVTTKATSVLKGHVTPICQIVMDSDHQQIISISKDNIIKIWDTRDQLCIQTIPSRLVHMGGMPITTAYYNVKLMTLLLGGSSLVAFDKKEKFEFSTLDDEPTSHSKPLCGALYNDLFNQVVSACHGSVINVWQLDTGEKSIMFKVSEDEIEVTAMTFDPSKRRLITGTRGGTVRIWNFNNGACLRELQSADDSEITGIACLKRKIVFTGWNRLISIFGEGGGNEAGRPRILDHVHKDDILSLDIYNSTMAATASYDGQIVVWSLETGRIFNQFNVNDVKGNKKYQGFLSNELENSSNSLLPPINPAKDSPKGEKSNQDQPFAVKQNQKKAMQPTEESVKHAVQHLAVDKILFLKDREHACGTASLLTSSAGLIQAWSLAGGGLLRQFRATRTNGESILSMVTDSRNNLLITVDSIGYISAYDISKYAIEEKKEEMPPVKEKAKPGFRRLVRSKMLSSNTGNQIFKGKPDGFLKLVRDLTSDVNTTPPEKIMSFRGHTQSIVSVDYVEEKQILITASTDCSVRVWTLDGKYVGTFGQKRMWESLETIYEPNRQKLMPVDIQRVASKETLRGLTRPGVLWGLARNLVKFFGATRRRSVIRPGSSLDSEDLEKKEQELQKRLKVTKIPVKEILGRNYKPKRRHKAPPSHIRQRIVQTQCLAYSSLPFCELQIVPEMPIPAIVAKRQLEKPSQSVKQDVTRFKPMHRSRRDGSVFQGNAFARRQSLMRR